SGNTYFLIR
ncbi:binding--dependent transport system inner membrane component family protein, partial [Chlamydia psittaci 84-8471/1]